MKKEIWRSSISTDLLQHTLKRGGWLGGSGALLLIAAGMFLPLALLKVIGIPIFLVGMFFIVIGWLPYKRLVQLQLHPDELHYDGIYLIYSTKSRPLFQIPSASIETIAYLESGLGIKLKRPVEHKIKILSHHSGSAQWSQQEGWDLYLRHFSERTCQELQEFINPLE